ncbi:MAG: DUF1223 domain-containing protein [Hyphomicrobiales bacterium]|nr:DUF1223 domain-containing protein [Hyphomicrobiales bacterium]MCP5373168.1 DUF1223 domain-containing protein [Hyphomicrobiales bacterium]
MQVRTTINLLAAALLLFPLFSIPSSQAAASDPSPTQAGRSGLIVVELFTSQGCSSCPPADAYLRELAEVDGILPLSMHVDYWDYIGWKDPFAMPAVKNRQRDYAVHFGLRYVYTPQAVVHGTVQATGSDRRAIGRAIDALRGAEQLAVTLSHGADGGLSVALPGGAAPDKGARVMLVVFDNQHETAIKRGENRGRTLKYRNVVRAFRSLGAWDGQAETLQVSAKDLGAMPGDACAVIVQAVDSGHVLGAASLPLRH